MLTLLTFLTKILIIDWAEEVEEQQSPETEDGGSNLQWMPQSEPNQMMHHSTEMYNLPPSAHASFIPVPPSNQPYSGIFMNAHSVKYQIGFFLNHSNTYIS